MLEPQRVIALRQTVLQISGLEQTVLSLLDRSVLQLSITVQFYLENNRKIYFRGVRACRPPKDTKRNPRALWLLFFYMFPPLVAKRWLLPVWLFSAEESPAALKASTSLINSQALVSWGKLFEE